jgi:type IV pilus assembly protein PilA
MAAAAAHKLAAGRRASVRLLEIVLNQRDRSISAPRFSARKRTAHLMLLPCQHRWMPMWSLSFSRRGEFMKQLQKGFTLIELMIVVAIVGILAAIALPAYQDYVVRSKMSEVEGAIAACKTSVAEYTATKGSFPADITAAGCSATATQYLASLTVATGVITATSQNTGAAPECVLTLTPTPGANAAEITQWTGSFSACAAKYVPSVFRP